MESCMDSETLRNHLEQFKEVSLVLKSKLIEDEHQAIEQLMDERQHIIDRMDTCGFDNDDFRSICHGLDILQLEEEIAELMKSSKEETRQRILELKSRKEASRSYNEGFYGKSHFLNRKL